MSARSCSLPSILGGRSYGPHRLLPGVPGAPGGLSLVTLVAISAAFLAYRLAPQTVVQPLFLLGEMVAPALLGLYVFAEREAFDRWEYLSCGLGLASGLVVVLSFV